MTREYQQINNQLNDLRLRLSFLERDLPKFTSQLVEVEASENSAKEKGNPISDLARLKTEVIAAREMLNDHQQKISETKTEMKNLETLHQQEALKARAVEIAIKANEEAKSAEKIFSSIADLLLNYIPQLKQARGYVEKLAPLRDDFVYTLHKLELITGEKIIYASPDKTVSFIEGYADLDVVLSPWKGSDWPRTAHDRIIGIKHTHPLGKKVEELALSLIKTGLLEAETSKTNENPIEGSENGS